MDDEFNLDMLKKMQSQIMDLKKKLENNFDKHMTSKNTNETFTDKESPYRGNNHDNSTD